MKDISVTPGLGQNGTGDCTFPVRQRQDQRSTGKVCSTRDEDSSADQANSLGEAKPKAAIGKRTGKSGRRGGRQTGTERSLRHGR